MGLLPLNLSDVVMEDVAPTLSPHSSEGRAGKLIAVHTACLAVTTIFIALRVYVRTCMLRKWGVDDWALMASYAAVVATGIIQILTTVWGVGKHTWAISTEDRIIIQKLAIVEITLYQVSMTAIKVAFLLQYHKSFPLPGFQRLCKILLVFVVIFGVAQTVVAAVPCVPLRAFWDWSIPTTCINFSMWWYINSGVNLATDLIIILMPLPLLRNLPLARLPKFILMAIFGLGFFTSAISIVRITVLVPNISHPDITYTLVIPNNWTILELCCGILCICIPTLRPLLGRLGKFKSGYQQQASNASGFAEKPAMVARGSGQAPSTPLGEPPPAHLNCDIQAVRKGLKRFSRLSIISRISRAGDSDDGIEDCGVEQDEGRDVTTPTALQPPPPMRKDSMVLGSMDLGPPRKDSTAALATMGLGLCPIRENDSRASSRRSGGDIYTDPQPHLPSALAHQDGGAYNRRDH